MSLSDAVHLKPDHGMIGSVQHYWHFMFGYLLPAMDYITTRDGADETYLIESCGPVMDKLLVEALPALGADFRILDKAEIATAFAGCQRVDLDHWDHYTLDPAKRDELRSRIDRVVPILRARMPNRCPCGVTETCRNRILLLDRSSMPDFYKPGGGTDSPSYGSARRAIRNLAETRQRMRARGYPVIVYEPGRHELGCQIDVFSNARGVVGIRGAEFANMLWAPAGIPVYMLTPVGPRQPRAKYQECLSGCLRQNFVEGFCGSEVKAQVLELDEFESHFRHLRSPWRQVLWNLYRLSRLGKV
ncbi:glycosyltransferase 61 family protein [Parvibaculum sp.]|jgi:hypothetical protein|uniref:glycosyltransferase 61 family protein n=1 Tax=Parvibaculum sp. TaxID=2024848 RepID=UPI002FD99E9F